MTSGPTKRRKHYLCLLFSQYWTWAEKSQWSRHLFEKSIPGLFYSKPPRKVSATELELRTTKLKKPEKTTNLFSNLDFVGPIWGAPPRIFQRCSMDFPRIFHGFPTHPFLSFRGGRGSGRQISRPGSLGRAPYWMFGGLEEVGGTRKNHTHRCLCSLNYLAERKVRKTTHNESF